MLISKIDTTSSEISVKNRTTGQITFWKCKMFRTTLCKGKAVTIKSDEDPDIAYIKSTSEHNHESSIADIILGALRRLRPLLQRPKDSLWFCRELCSVTSPLNSTSCTNGANCIFRTYGA